MSITDTDYDYEPDQDYTAAEAPLGFAFNEAGDALEAVEADKFPERSMEPVEGLLWLGYLSEDLELYGHRFTIRTLTRGDKLIVTLMVKEWEETLGAADAYETATVAASLVAIDGDPRTIITRSGDRTASIRRNFEEVKGWYEPMINTLFERVM